MRIKQAVVVEGTYDKIKLSEALNAMVITTDGFDIMHNTEKLDYIRKLAKTCGIVVLTDSDRAGFMIRNFIKGAVPEGEVLHAFVPDLKGKEKRKKKPSREGLLGVEGMSADIIREALIKAGCREDSGKNKEKITKTDFFENGLIGGDYSREKRDCLAKMLGLPKRISANGLLEAVNRFLSREEYKKTVTELNT